MHMPKHLPKGAAFIATAALSGALALISSTSHAAAAGAAAKAGTVPNIKLPDVKAPDVPKLPDQPPRGSVSSPAVLPPPPPTKPVTPADQYGAPPRPVYDTVPPPQRGIYDTVPPASSGYSAPPPPPRSIYDTVPPTSSGYSVAPTPPRGAYDTVPSSPYGAPPTPGTGTGAIYSAPPGAGTRSGGNPYSTLPLSSPYGKLTLSPAPQPRLSPAQTKALLGAGGVGVLLASGIVIGSIVVIAEADNIQQKIQGN